MKKLLTLLLIATVSVNLLAQETPEKVMEKRAREMHRIITLDSKDEWKKFIRENYTQELIDKPMQAKVEVEENGRVVSSTPEQPTGEDKIEAKVPMFGQLHADFGASKISSLKMESNKAKMVLTTDGLTGIISLQFEKNKPYKIAGLSIEVKN